MTVRDYMKQKVFSVRQDATVEMAAAVIRKHRVGTLPVVDLENKLVGMLRLESLLALVMPDFVHLIEHFEFAHNFGSLERTKPEPDSLKHIVAEIMEEPVSVTLDSGILRAAAVLHFRDLRDLPVVDSENTLVGLVSHVDLGIALMKSWNLHDISGDTSP